MRRKLPAMKQGPAGETVVLPAELQPGESCRLEYCGSSWSAVNGGKVAIAAGQRARIDRVDGLTLVVHGRKLVEHASLGYAAIVIAILVVVVIAKTATVVPQQSAFVIEHLGKYSRTLSAGFHILDAVHGADRLPSTASRKSRSISPSRSASPATTCRSASTRCCTCR